MKTKREEYIKNRKEEFFKKKKELEDDLVELIANFQIGQNIKLKDVEGREREATIVGRRLSTANRENLKVIYKVNDLQLESYHRGNQVPCFTIWEEEKLEGING